MKITTGEKTYSSAEENSTRKLFFEHFKNSPLPDEQVLQNLGLFLNSKTLARILFMHFAYQHILNIPGVVLDFGTRWGQNMSLFAALRGIFEPFNRHRKIIGFDTFSGFPSVSPKDGNSPLMEVGSVTVTDKYADYLNRVMECQELDNPLSHIKKFEIRSGDATVEIEKYLKDNPETIVALAYFDFDIYEPTKSCLLAIKDRVTKGSILCFDELNDHDSPGETTALMEVFGVSKISLKRLPFVSRISYFVVE